MTISQQIEAVYRRALALRDRATDHPIQQELLETALKELYFVLEELHAADEELHQQNLALAASQFEVKVERQRYQALFELAPDGYLVTDKQGKIHHANKAASRLFAVPQSALVGKPLIVLIDEGDRAPFQQRLLRPHSTEPWEVTLTTRQVEPITLAITTNYLKDSRHQSTTILWSLRDVTYRRQMEQQLQAAYNDLEHQVADRTADLVAANAQLQQEIAKQRQAEQTIRYQAHLIDVATDAIYVLDPQQCITFWNRGAETLYGWTTAEAVGQNVVNLLGRSDPEAPAPTISESGHWQGEVSHQTKNGQPVTVLSRQTPIDEERDRPPSTLVVNTNITEKKQLEAEFLRSQRLESLGILARSIAHDLNNILTPLTIVPHVLLQQLPESDTAMRSMLESIKSAAQRGNELSKQILTFAGKTQGELVLVQIDDLFQEVQQFVQLTFPKNIAIQIAIADDLQPVLADATLLYQVLLNLCVNARDAMPQGGILSLSAANATLETTHQNQQAIAHPGDYVLVTVADTGPGIAPEILDQIFDPFFTTKPADRGSGLGLSTVAKIVKDCGGFVSVLSEVGIGCQFQMYLPVGRGSTSSPVMN
jgi:two-component system cell cycle sensor histidine kinase/response regulator CckA